MAIKILFATIALTLAMLLIPKNKNNVCKTFEDYYSDRDSNDNCYYNPDHELTVPEIIQRNGYPVETREVVSSDGYILTVFRIPYGKHSNFTHQRGKPVFIQHGACVNSGCFVNTGSKCLAFILAEAGYDVWLGNFRGTEYSRNHVSLNSNDSEYWNFSFHEFGVYDLPAMITLVYTVTNEKMVYIGHSLGTTSMYVYTSTYPNVAREKVKLFINLAPAAFVGEDYFTAPKFGSHFWHLVEPIIGYFTKGYVPSPYIVPSVVLRYLCLPFPFQMKLCMVPNVIVLGTSYKHSDPETLPVTLIHNGDKSSIKTWAHHSQLMCKRTFEQYDYGEKGNLNYYGTTTPPGYNLTNIVVPMYFIVGQSDWMVTKSDVDKLYNALPEAYRPRAIYVVEDKDIGHQELIVSKNVVPLVFNHIINVLNNLS